MRRRLQTEIRDYEELKLRGALLQGEPKSVDLAWLDQQISALQSLVATLDDLRRKHEHGLVYAIRFEEKPTFSSCMGLEIDSVPLKCIIAKVRIPAEWQYDEYREDPHRLRALGVE